MLLWTAHLNTWLVTTALHQPWSRICASRIIIGIPRQCQAWCHSGRNNSRGHPPQKGVGRHLVHFTYFDLTHCGSLTQLMDAPLDVD